MNILITGAWQCCKEQLDVVRSYGHTVISLSEEASQLPCPADRIEGVICNGLFLYHPIDEFKNLRYIQLTSAGYDRVPIKEIERRGITIHNARGVYSIPMAEMALCGVLNLYKQMEYFYEKKKSCLWEKRRDLAELNGKTVCIVGCGSVGSECAKRFTAFGCKVFGIDLRPHEAIEYSTIYDLSELDRVLPLSDVIVLTLPLTDQTKHLINMDRLIHLKRGAILVNIARGAIIDEHAMIEALSTRPLGAVLDVFEEEPLAPDSPLWQMKNVVLTPHSSFIGDGNKERLNDIILKNLELYSE